MAGPSGSGRLEAARDALVRDLASYRRRKGTRLPSSSTGGKEVLGPNTESSSRAWRSCIPSGGERADQVVQRLARLYGRGLRGGILGS